MQPNARIPCRPLSYQNVALAEKREVILDYDNGVIYFKNDRGQIVCINTNIAETVLTMIANDNEDYNLGHAITIVYQDNRYPLDEFVSLIKDYTNGYGEVLGYKEVDTIDPNTGAHYNKPTSTVLDNLKARVDNHDLLIQANTVRTANNLTRICTLDEKKTTTYKVDLTLPAAASWTTVVANKHYTYRVNVSNIKETDIPMLYLLHSTDLTTSNDEDKNFNIFKFYTYNGYVIFHFRKAPTRTLNVRLVVNRVIQTGLPSSDTLIPESVDNGASYIDAHSAELTATNAEVQVAVNNALSS